MNLPDQPPSIFAFLAVLHAAEKADEHLPMKARLHIHANRLRGTAALLDRAAEVVATWEANFTQACERLTATQAENKTLREEIESLRDRMPTVLPPTGKIDAPSPTSLETP